MMTGPHGIIGIDLDGCIVDGKPTHQAADIIARANSYTEISPSGLGYRILIEGSLDADWCNHAEGIEVYAGNQARFLTITGDVLPGSPMAVQSIPPDVLAGIQADFAKEVQKAEVIHLRMPELLDDFLLPDIQKIGLNEKAETFLLTGEHGGDRSGTLHAAGVALFSAGLADDVVLSILVTNEHAMGVALDHRRQDYDRALAYLWQEHCLKAKPKASRPASPDDFDVVAVDSSAPDWPKFKRDKNGAIEASLDNIVKALCRSDICGVTIKLDNFRNEIMFALHDDPTGWRPFRDADYSRLRITLEHKQFKPIGREIIRDAVLLVADDHTFDSAMVWLDGLEWDGTPRVESFLVQYFGAEDSAYVRSVSLYIWTAMAGRVMVPGIKADMVPIMIGDQGVLKSSSVAAMVPSPEFFTEISFHEKDEDLARKMRGKLVAEIGELRGLHTRELESIKAFITRTHEHWVPKYREFTETYARRLLFIGTTNQEQFLADETGNRRWCPVQTGTADIDAVKRDHLQLWAEGKVLFDLLGVAYQQAEQLAKQVHAQHTITEPWTEDIAKWLDSPDLLTGEIPRNRDFLQTGEIAREALRIDSKSLGKREEMRIGNSLRELGYERVRFSIGGVQKRVWAKNVTT